MNGAVFARTACAVPDSAPCHFLRRPRHNRFNLIGGRARNRLRKRKSLLAMQPVAATSFFRQDCRISRIDRIQRGEGTLSLAIRPFLFHPVNPLDPAILSKKSMDDFSSKHSAPREVGDRADGDRNAVRQQEHAGLALGGDLRQLLRVLDRGDLVENRPELIVVLVPGAP